MAVLRWLVTAFSTYLLHSEHGNGYQWWSGPGVVLALLWNAVTFAVKHNCYEHGCPWVGRVIGDDNHRRCKRHHRRTHPTYGR